MCWLPLQTALYCVGEFGDLLVAKDKTHLLAADKEHLLGVPSGSSDDPSAAALSLTAEEVVDTLAAISQALQEGQGKKGGNAAAIAVAAAATATSAPALSSITEALMTCLAKLTTRLPDQVSVWLCLPFIPCFLQAVVFFLACASVLGLSVSVCACCCACLFPCVRLALSLSGRFISVSLLLSVFPPLPNRSSRVFFLPECACLFFVTCENAR